ncbi:conserved Plasmodium protein, unknown function [Plasmodium malariae]|uniref:Uncharacterized protein n=1 Tax=Plasmodium malariae TaxID=5858 RepID=A0A1A8VWV4_PLAMA|nr:conserved Plasmodium protein, unknown function [Plasmodium malariae]SBS84187.1 hypothetical protein PMALA_009070 [Plasmodium malariae]SCN12060.1 conserved Plasmodium protein, unknown function [Plasmodium malariae]
MLFTKTGVVYKQVINLIVFYFFTNLIIIVLCNKSKTLRDRNILNYKWKRKLELQPNRTRKSKYAYFIYSNNLYRKVDVNEREYKLNDDLKNIILLFGRIAEHYYPNTAEQFNLFKEPYSKYIYTNENNSSLKWKHVFNNYHNKKIDKNVFYEKICELKFKWPINEDENITEHNFYNLVIEKCLNNIYTVRNNIHNLKILLTKIIENKKNKKNKGNKENEENIDYSEGTQSSQNSQNDQTSQNGQTNQTSQNGQTIHSGEVGDNVYINNLYDELEKEFINENEDLYHAPSSTSSGLANDKRIKLLEKLENFHLNDIFKQPNRSYSRLLVNEVFNREYPSKKTTDIFLYLVFQKNVEEFSYEHFLKYLNRLGKKIELYNCNYNSNIYFDHFFFLMKNEIKKSSIQLKNKKYFSSPKIDKAKKEYPSNKNNYENSHNTITYNNKKKKKKNSIIMEQELNSHKFNKFKGKIKDKEEGLPPIENLNNQSKFIMQASLHNEKNIYQNKKLQTDVYTTSKMTGSNFKNKIISLFNYIVNTIKMGF